MAVFPLQGFELLAHQNIVFRLIGVNEFDAGLFVASRENGVQDLQHGSNARSTGHHGNLVAEPNLEGLTEWFGCKVAVTLPFQVSFGTLDEDCVLTDF